ncbi:hypothetical protein U9M48_013768 [Paspalum notatum var. saurae]|uniref:AB hydrolase-1 domain-containing protein n=1 Tax=Paspalum notatum var. saurae TaxID=547442 RepID=A0AAQ3SZV4_PASNO
MVNWVHVAKQQLVHRLARRAGLRRHTVDVDDSGTVISIWLPKDKLPAANEETRKKEAKPDRGRLSVVLLHGFAGDGILTWVLQVGALAKHYDVYVPDLLFFGGSTSPAGGDKSPEFQAECVVGALRRLGVERCAVVGFSYGGFVAFRMAEAHPGLVVSVVATGSIVNMTRSTRDAMLRRLGAVSLAGFLLPDDVAGLRSLFAAGTNRKWWFPERVLQDYLSLMIYNRKERAQLLEALVSSKEQEVVAAPSFQQDILLLWGENDSIFLVEVAKSLKKQLGEKAKLRSIGRAGHLVMLERPWVFNRYLREFLEAAAATHGDDGIC